ncbi:MAG TPA: T9SS type A sorting domain-containing protein [Bacteroidia bacterium]|nr:T9SS type A sorting domain-containing protein [Bacteroidia bacterium]
MKKYLLTLASFSLFFGLNASAQDWRSMMNDPTVNVHDVQKAFYKWYATQPQNNSSVTDKDEEEENGAYTLFKRWEWFYVQRTFPTGDRPNPAQMEKDYNTFLASQKASHKSTKASSSSNWSYFGSIGDANLSGVGRVNHIRFMPGNPNTMFACSPSGGLWKSTNGGTTWSTNTDHLIDLAVDDIAINPLNTNVQYIGMGDGDGGYAGYTPSTVGVFRSNDGGVTWNPTGMYLTLPTSGPSVTTIQQLLLNPVDTGVIFAATTSGLFYSSNGGNYWTSVIKGHDIRDVEFMAKHTDVVFASGFDGTFWRSSNYGASFTQITGGWASTDRLEIGVTPADSEYVFVLAGNSNTGGFSGIYLSTNGGTSFTQKSTQTTLGKNPMGWDDNGGDLSTGQAWYDLSIAVSPTDKDSIIIGGVDLWASANDGTSFGTKDITQWDASTNAAYVHADVHHISYDPTGGKYIIAATDGGIFKVALSGSTATASDINNNLSIAQQYGIGLSQQTSTMFLTGWQDNGTNLSAASNTAWTQATGGDGTLCFIDYTNQNTQYASYPEGTLYANTGSGFNTITNGLTGNGPWVTEFLEDPHTPKTIYCGFQDVFYSTNQGTNWTKKSTWGGTAGLNEISAIAIDSSNNSVVYAGGYSNTASQIECTTNITATTPTWTNISSGLPTTTAAISAIAVNPKNPAQVWVTFSGYNATAKVYYSANGNTATPTWTNLSAGLPNLPVNCVFYESGTNNGIYVGIDGGVYYRDNTTPGWVNFSTGMPNVVVLQLAMYNSTHNLRAATFGRGTWATPHWTAPSTAPTAMFTGFPTTYCVHDTVQYTDTSSGQPTSWSWTFQSGNPGTSTMQNPVVIYSVAGTYSVSLTATNANGSNTLTKTGYITVNPDPVTPTISQAGQVLTCTPTGSTYQWFYGGKPIPNATADTYTQSPTLPFGDYAVVVTNNFGCSSDSGSFKVTALTAVDEISLNNQIGIYPNPTNGNMNVVLNFPEGDYNMNIVNVLGQTIYSDKVHVSGQYNSNIDMSGYGKGVYFLTVEGQNSKAEKKILVY